MSTACAASKQACVSSRSCPLTHFYTADSSLSCRGLTHPAFPRPHHDANPVTQLTPNCLLHSWSCLTPLRRFTMPPRHTPRKRALPAPPPADTTDEEEADGTRNNMTVDAPTAAGLRVEPAVAPLSPTDTAGIAQAIFEHSRPEWLTAQKSIVTSMEELVSSLLDEKLAALVDKGGPLASLTRGIVKEEVNAYSERQPHADTVADGITQKVTTAVLQVIKTTPQTRSADQMGREELTATVTKAVGGFKRFRTLLPGVLNRRITALAEDARKNGRAAAEDVLTISFPAASKKNKTYSNTEFDKMIKSLLHALYDQNRLKPVNERPAVLRRKTQLDVNAIDAVDAALLALGRSALHDGRSEARKLFFKLFAYFFMTAGASMQLSTEDARPPALGAGADSAFFAVSQQLRVSETGDVLAPSSEAVHVIKRRACLYHIADILLQGIVLQPHTFDAVAINAAACNLRDILLSTEPYSEDSSSSAAPSWTNEPHKDAEKQKGPGVWSLLLPMIDGRAALTKEIQTMTSIEKQALRDGDDERSVGDDESTGEDIGITPATPAADRPSWL